jgi:hypothetical protein
VASELDLLLLRAHESDTPVSITLDSGKAYAGLVVKITDPERSPSTITLLPLLSGHRDENGKLIFTTDYSAIYAALENPED